MNIEKTNLSFTSLTKRSTTNGIVIHHSAGNKKDDAYSIHKIHKNKGWAGCGYHFVIKWDGTIQEGRPENCTGAHATNHNSTKIGICFAGWFEDSHDGKPTDAQYKSCIELVKYLMNKYKLTVDNIYRHGQLNATGCPCNVDVNYIKKQANSNDPIPTPEATPTPTPKPEPQPDVYTYTMFVKDVQSAIGAKVDGIAGKETLSKTPTLSRSYNNNHKAVKPVQKYLNSLGYACGTVDGIYGANTAQGVKNYQKAIKGTQDGIITARGYTWKNLLKMR